MSGGRWVLGTPPTSGNFWVIPRNGYHLRRDGGGCLGLLCDWSLAMTHPIGGRGYLLNGRQPIECEEVWAHWSEPVRGPEWRGRCLHEQDPARLARALQHHLGGLEAKP